MKKKSDNNLTLFLIPIPISNFILISIAIPIFRFLATIESEKKNPSL